ncbi:MAG: copper amine oxidase N-terminal domain-containing protein [Bacillota bacterium]
MSQKVRLIGLALVGLLLLSGVAGAAGDYKGFAVVHVLVNGRPVQSDVPGIMVDGRTMLPVRAVAEAVGAQVEWDAATFTVKLTTGSGAAPAGDLAAAQSRIQQLEEENAKLKAQLAGTEGAPTQPAVEGFRGLVWGSTPEQVKSKETATFLGAEGDNLYYTGVELDGANYAVVYRFLEGHLAAGYYILDEEFYNNNRYIDTYSSLRRLLIEKYGAPVNPVDQIWKDDLFRDSPSDWGLAVAAEDLVYRSEWQTPESTIRMVLSGKNFDISLVVAYFRTSSMDRLESGSRGETLNDL